MGLLESLWGQQEKEQIELRDSNTPFRASLRFSPLRLSAMKDGRDGRVDLVVNVQNTTHEPQLVSVDALLPKHEMLGFEPTCINKVCENRIGTLMPGETKELRLSIWGSNQTQQGDYPLEVHIYSHYQNYDKVINYIKKSASLRVV